MNQPVAALARRISAGRVARYVVSETDGGPGFTEAIAWRDGGVIFGPSGTGCYDEYETVGLMKHRMTGDWLNEG